MNLIADNAERITKEKAKPFWEWFGPVLTTIRFKRHIRTLWFEGLVYGLISKRECNRMLKGESVGTFIIRFSDSVAGSFAVAYATADVVNSVKHYLVKPEDIGSNKALPDFLSEKKIFSTIIRYRPQTGESVKAPKEESFKVYFSKRGRTKPNPQGYVQNLES